MTDGLLTRAKGYGISDTKNWSDFSIKEFQLKPAQDRDVTLKITCCGVCGCE